MYRTSWLTVLVFFAALAVLTASLARAQSASVTGTVTDAEDGLPLIGANVVLYESDGVSMVGGAATDANGRYEITGIEPSAYVLAFQFLGHAEFRLPITLAAGASEVVDAALRPTGVELNPVIVTASRLAEKALDAPASISVMDADEIQMNPLPSSAAVLRNTMGVDMAQTGIDRYEIVLRGFNNAFSGAAYVLTDYRQGAIASLRVNANQMMPITQIDLERVEDVRGPGSALYGPGVVAGVIHLMSQAPYTYPGPSVTVGGGTREMLIASARHAGVVNGKLGYKVVGNFSRAEEWHFDPDDPLDAVQLCSFRSDIEGEDVVDVTCEIDGELRVVQRELDYGNYKYNINGTLSYRFRPDVTLTANGGFSSSKRIFLSGIGTLQSDGFGYSYGQLRLDAGRFFAQAYVNANNAGNSFVYRETAVADVVDNSILFNAQAQYNLDLMQDRLALIMGVDYELTSPDTDRTINGRNEDDDQTHEVGAYVQGTMNLTPKLDATAALRTDYNTVVEQIQLSPRAALVYKPTNTHSVRATYNRAFSSPGTNSLFLDIAAGSAGPLSIRARGAAHGFTFQRDPDGHLIASSLIPEIFGNERPAGMPLDVVYNQIYAQLASIPVPQLQALLQQQGINLPDDDIAAIVAMLSPTAGTNVSGFTPSGLGYLNLTTLSIDRLTNDVVDIAPLRQTVSQTFEVGYKGLLGEKVLLGVDAYYVTKRDFIGPLVVESPFVLAPEASDVIDDMGPAIVAGVAGNAALVDFLQQRGLSPELVGALIMQLATPELQTGLPVTGSPIGIVQPIENAIPGQLLLTYRNYGDVSYYGVDLSAQVIATDRLDIFANLSWVNDNFFDADEL